MPIEIVRKGRIDQGCLDVQKEQWKQISDVIIQALLFVFATQLASYSERSKCLTH